MPTKRWKPKVAAGGEGLPSLFAAAPKCKPLNIPKQSRQASPPRDTSSSAAAVPSNESNSSGLPTLFAGSANISSQPPVKKWSPPQKTSPSAPSEEPLINKSAPTKKWTPPVKKTTTTTTLPDVKKVQESVDKPPPVKKWTPPVKKTTTPKVKKQEEEPPKPVVEKKVEPPKPAVAKKVEPPKPVATKQNPSIVVAKKEESPKPKRVVKETPVPTSRRTSPELQHEPVVSIARKPKKAAPPVVEKQEEEYESLLDKPLATDCEQVLAALRAAEQDAESVSSHSDDLDSISSGPDSDDERMQEMMGKFFEDD